MTSLNESNMAASCHKLSCRLFQLNKSPNIMKTLFLPNVCGGRGLQRYFGTTQQLSRNYTNSHCTINHNRHVDSTLLYMSPRLRPAAAVQFTRRPFSNDSDDGRESKQKIKPVFVAIPNPFKVIRNKIYFWMIRSYFDAEFRAEDFTSGAKQALCTISSRIAEGNFDQLEGLLSKKLLDEVKETCHGLALRDRTNMLVTTDDVLHVFPQNVAVHYDESGGKFLNILMRFWCHSMVTEESDKGVVGLRIGRPPPGMSEEEFKNMGSVISCTYEFHRDFSAGVDPSWIVTYIQHGKWLNTQARWLPKEWSR